jgi:hypothetical protein
MGLGGLLKHESSNSYMMKNPKMVSIELFFNAFQ